MANRTLRDRSGMSLQLNGSDIVVRVPDLIGRPNGMGAAVAVLAAYSSVVLTVTIQDIEIFCKSLVIGENR